MMTKIVSVLILLIAGFNVPSIGTIQIENYDKYCNARFAYCLDYPDFLNPQPESQNGDGRIFINKNGEEALRVFGRLNLDAEGDIITFKQQFINEIHENKMKKNLITYKKLGKTFFVISGYRNGKIFYQKTIMKKDAFAFAILEYSKNDKAVYDKVSTEIFKSFK